jgi:hypothetical protein
MDATMTSGVLECFAMFDINNGGSWSSVRFGTPISGTTFSETLSTTIELLFDSLLWSSSVVMIVVVFVVVVAQSIINTQLTTTRITITVVKMAVDRGIYV